MGVFYFSAAIGEERGTIEDVIEPFLIQQGFLMRTPRGRMATRHAWKYFGLKQPEDQDSEDFRFTNCTKTAKSGGGALYN